MARCLVLGGEGFIGTHLVRELVAAGHVVTCSTRRERATGCGDVQYVFVDFLNASDLDRAVRGQDVVFHAISLTNPAVSDADRFIDLETNVRMSVHLMQSCSAAGVRKLVFISSGGAIYGDSRGEPLTELHVAEPISPYGIGKLAIEGYLRLFRKRGELDSLVLRLSNVYGPGQRTSHGRHGVISVFLDHARNGRPVRIFGDGSMTRDYIHVLDVARIMANCVDKSTRYDTYNIGSGVPTSISQIADTVELVSGERMIREYLRAPESYVSHVVLDCSRAHEEWGPLARISLIDGLRTMYETLTQLGREPHRPGEDVQ